jgi:hypothetical protein
MEDKSNKYTWFISITKATKATKATKEPTARVDFCVASDLDDIRRSNILLSSRPLPLDMPGLKVP